jgi:hypothetical protein
MEQAPYKRRRLHKKKGLHSPGKKEVTQPRKEGGYTAPEEAGYTVRTQPRRRRR